MNNTQYTSTSTVPTVRTGLTFFSMSLLRAVLVTYKRYPQSLHAVRRVSHRPYRCYQFSLLATLYRGKLTIKRYDLLQRRLLRDWGMMQRIGAGVRVTMVESNEEVTARARP